MEILRSHYKIITNSVFVLLEKQSWIPAKVKNAVVILSIVVGNYKLVWPIT